MAPAIANNEQHSSQDPSPRLAPNTSTANYHFSSPLSPAQLPSPQRYEFEYGVQPSALSQSNLQQWNGNSSNEQQMFTAGNPEHIYGNPFGPYPSPLDGYASYEPVSDLPGGVGGMSASPTSSSYATSLPFRGLDFIRNYNPNGYAADQDSLWQSYDPGAFGYDPDLPFTLGDTNNELSENVH